MTQQSGKRKVYSVGNYRFTGKLLGKGNFARVEEAVHNILNVKVAIKVIDVKEIKEKYVIKNLYREATIMSKLNHPCITALYETMQRSDNVYYIVTELIAGGDLCTFIKSQRNGKLSELATRVYARQFASALSHMHNLGVVHRDLKMENVMLNSIQTQIKIVDFGLSNVWNKDQSLQTHCGSPEYAAPELFVSGKQYGPEVDLWSLGIILYGMVVGQLPFVCEKRENLSSQERRKNLIMQINRGLASNQKRALATLSSDFRHLVNSLLTADATNRLNVKGLITHPWITEKDKKYIRTNPLKSIDKQVQAKIISEISCMCKISIEQVISEIKTEKLGPISGMFHILSRRYRINQLNGDGITKTLSTYVFESYSSRFPAELNTKEIIRLINPGSSRPTRSSAIKPKNVPSLNKKEDESSQNYPPSATLKRKVYSATLHTRNYQNLDSSAIPKYEPTFAKVPVNKRSEIDTELEKLERLLREKRPQSTASENLHQTLTPKPKSGAGRVTNKSAYEQNNNKKTIKSIYHKTNLTQPSNVGRPQTPNSVFKTRIQELLPKNVKPNSSAPLARPTSSTTTNKITPPGLRPGYISLHSKKK